MNQPDLFSAEIGQRLKDEGTKRVGDNNEPWTTKAARAIAERAKHGGHVTSDDIYVICPPPPGTHPNAIGAAMRKAGLMRIGYTTSQRAEAHGRVIAVWIAP